ncbi:hypothetical protein [uncultured Shimia sp.]|uniref:hypothetical protein n=1 Tax=uncultured Shimia sp. TaxID=573152 RepID=UPI0026034E7E|nr:hypothetical protein [uncultured Shimia sp.]
MTSWKAKIVIASLLMLGLKTLAISETVRSPSPLRYFVAADNEAFAENMINLLDTYTLVYDGTFGTHGRQVSQFIFLQKRDAISNGKIAKTVLKGIDGSVNQQLLSEHSESDECFVSTYPTEDGWPVTFVISTTVDNQNGSLQCFAVGLSYHVTERVPDDPQQSWRKTYLDLLQAGAVNE